MMIKKVLSLFLISFVIWTGCIRQPTKPDPPPAQGALQGTVKSALGIVYPSYIFIGNRLIVEPDMEGTYQVDALDAGTYQLTASALCFADTTVQITIVGGETTTLDFDLTLDFTMGFLLGEFQDDSLFQAQLLENPDLADWTDKEICDAATGATLQYKTLQPFIPYCYVRLGEDTLIMADAWGQYGIQIQCGTYPFTGTCNDYQSMTGVAQITSDGNAYLNFFLPRED